MKLTLGGYAVLCTWIALYVVIIVFYFQVPFFYLYSAIARMLALLGITSLFNASYISAYMAQAHKAFGISYLKMHHTFAIAGFCLITAHPISIFIIAGITTVYAPNFESYGDLSIPLVIIATMALAIVYISTISILIKKMLVKHWRFMHGLIYIAIGFGLLHGFFLGEDLYFDLVMQCIFIGMGIFLAISFGLKRYTTIQAKKRSNA